MKILVLTGKLGMGHISASHAITEELEAQHQVTVVDIYQILLPLTYRIFYKLFNIIATHYGSIYNKICHSSKDIEKKNLLTKTLARVATKKITKLMTIEKPDMIISTVPVGSWCMDAYKKEKKHSLPVATCITDIDASMEWIHDTTNLYMVPTKETGMALEKKGVSKDKILCSGIPVRRNIKEKQFTPLTFTNPDKKINILVMGGGLGIIPLDHAMLSMLNNYPYGKVTFITGHNSKLKKHLEKSYKNIHVEGYVNDIHKHLKEAHVIITKPGGITLFECIHSALPIIALPPVLIQEISNAQYIQDKKIGCVLESITALELKKVLDSFINYPLTLHEYNINIHDLKRKLPDRPAIIASQALTQYNHVS